MDDQTLVKSRVLLLVAAVAEEEGSVRKAARRLGIDPSYPGKLRDDPTRFVGTKQLAAIKKRSGVGSAFFHDPSLGTAPDYREHLRALRLVRDDAPHRLIGFAHNAVADQILAATHLDAFVDDARFLHGDDASAHELHKALSSFFLAHPEARGARAPKIEAPKGETIAPNPFATKAPKGKKRVG